jgi:hypothetical protein
LKTGGETRFQSGSDGSCSIPQSAITLEGTFDQIVPKRTLQNAQICQFETPFLHFAMGSLAMGRP